MAYAVNDPTRQQFLPGFRPYFTKFFKKCCGDYDGEPDYCDISCSVGCEKPAAITAIWFETKQYKKDDKKPKFLGFDRLLDYSDRLYACSSAHLGEILTRISEDALELPIEPGSRPDVVVNAEGRIEKEIYVWLMKDIYGVILRPDFFQTKIWSQGRESLEQLWAREKRRFI